MAGWSLLGGNNSKSSPRTLADFRPGAEKRRTMYRVPTGSAGLGGVVDHDDCYFSNLRLLHKFSRICPIPDRLGSPSSV
jgi:hypothetical protein